MTMSIRSARALPVRLPVAGLCLALLALSACGHDAAPAAESTATPATAATPDAAAPVAQAPTPAAAAHEDAPVSGAAALVGLVVPPYPDGLNEIAGSCVPSGDGLGRVCDFGIAMVGDAAKGASAAMARFVTASRKADPGSDGKPRWQVLDAVDVPQLPPGYEMQLGACKFDGKDAPGLIAIVRYGAGETSADLHWVRRFDTDAGKLVEVETAKVSCANPAAGV